MATSFEDFVTRQHQMASEEERRVDWEREREEWKVHLDRFNTRVLEFLETYVEQKKVRIDRVRKCIHEQHIGKYEVEAIEVRLGNACVKLDPIGTNVIGAKGRVDMKGPNGTVRFVLVPENSSAPEVRVRIRGGGADSVRDDPDHEGVNWAWKISTPPPGIRYIELREEEFQTAIMEVVGG